MTIPVDWNAVGAMDCYEAVGDGSYRSTPCGVGPLYQLVRTAMTDPDPTRRYFILVGNQDLTPDRIEALFRRDDFPGDEDASG